MLYYVMIRNSIWKNNIAYKQIELVNHNLLLQITKCAAAGRDHLPCCLRRGVPVECQALCQGTQTHSENSVFGDCFAYIGNIMTCLEDGIIHIYYLHDFFEFLIRYLQIPYFNCLRLSHLGWIDLPEPVKNFHATYVQDSKISLSWDPVMIKGMNLLS